MKDRNFLDTSILVHAYDPHEPKKQNIAMPLVKRAMAGEFVISAQVLAEFASTLLHKAAQGRTPNEVLVILDILEPIRVVVPDRDMVRRAVEAQAQYGIHFYDAMIVAAAERAGCKKILSEDLHSGQQYFGAMVENPFV